MKRCFISGLWIALCGMVITVVLAELTGLRVELYIGMASGVLFCAIHWLTGRRMVARSRTHTGKRDIWSDWVLGVLARIALLIGVVILFAWMPNFYAPAALLTLAGFGMIGIFLVTRWVSAKVAEENMMRGDHG